MVLRCALAMAACLAAIVPPAPATAQSPVECADGADNDEDGFVDADDPGCAGPEDDHEFDGPVDVRAQRRVRLAFADWRRDRLVAFGRVTVVGSGPAECVAGVPVKILRRSRGRWLPVATSSTTDDGWYLVVAPDRTDRYRAVALRHEDVTAGGEYATCGRAAVVKPHRHA